MSNINNTTPMFRQWRSREKKSSTTDWFPVSLLSAAPADWAGVVLSVGGCSAALMASSWDCASALSPQSGKVAAKSNHLVTLGRCEEARRPLEDSTAKKTSFRVQVHWTKSGLDLHKRHLPNQTNILGWCFRCFVIRPQVWWAATQSSQSANNSCGFIGAAAGSQM